MNSRPPSRPDEPADHDGEPNDTVAAPGPRQRQPSGGRTRMPRTARRKMVLEAAREVFGRNGFHSASMDDIAIAAGVSKPVLYQHFPGKKELYEALLDDSSQSVLAKLRTAIDSADGPKQRVYATMNAFFDIVTAPNSELRLVFESDLVAQPEIRQKVDTVIRQTADMIMAQLEREIELDEPEARLLSIYLVGMAEVGARYWTEHRQAEVSRERAVEIAAALTWRGLRTFPARTPDGGSVDVAGTPVANSHPDPEDGSVRSNQPADPAAGPANPTQE